MSTTTNNGQMTTSSKALAPAKLKRLANVANQAASLGDKFAHSSISQALKALLHYHRAGTALQEVKNGLKHGEFSTWLKANFERDERSAQDYLRLAKNYTPDEITAGVRNETFVSIRGALNHVRLLENHAPTGTNAQILHKLKVAHACCATANLGIVEQSKDFIFTGDTLRTGNEYTCCEVASPLAITGAVEANRLYRILQRFKSQPLKFTEERHQLRIATDTCQATLAINPIEPTGIQELFDSVTRPKHWRKLPDPAAFAAAMDVAAHYATEDECRRESTVIYLAPKFIAAIDNHRAVRTYLNTGVKQPLRIHRTSWWTIRGFQPKELAHSRGFLHLRDGEFTYALPAKYFAQNWTWKFAPVFAEKGASVALPAKKLRLATERARSLINFYDFVDATDDPTLTVTLRTNKLGVTARDKHASYTETVVMSYTGPDQQFTVDPVCLLDLLQRGDDFFLSTKKLEAKRGATHLVVSVMGKA